MIARLNILGVAVDPTSPSEVIENIYKKSMTQSKGYITVTGVHGVMESQRNFCVKKAHTEAWLTVPDGMPLVYIGHLSGHHKMARCYGPDLMVAVMEASKDGSLTHYFYGGKEGRALELKTVFEKRYPGVRIIGHYTPPFRPLNTIEESELINTISDLKPDIFWVGLSTPKQELFMYNYLNKLDTKIMIGIGAAFDIHTGYISSAPNWMRKMALEWLFRLIQEPRRLAKRYLNNNPLFIFYFILQTLHLKKYNFQEEK